jgi:hypothetical protein
MNYKEILDAYWPVIEDCIEIQKHYAGKLDGEPKIAPNVSGRMIESLVKARKKYPLKREIVEE